MFCPLKSDITSRELASGVIDFCVAIVIFNDAFTTSCLKRGGQEGKIVANELNLTYLSGIINN